MAWRPAPSPPQKQAAICVACARTLHDGRVTEGEIGRLVVFQDRKWVVADPRLGAFSVSIDGTRVGIARVEGEFGREVSPGSHRVRIRQWWYRSPPVEVDVLKGETVRLRADIDRSVGPVRRMGRMLVHPSRSLTLTRVT